MKSPIAKRSIVVSGHKTSVSLEDAFWRGLKAIARTRQITLAKMVGEIDQCRDQSNLSSAIRLFVLDRLSNPTTHAAINGHCGSEAEHLMRHGEQTHV